MKTENNEIRIAYVIARIGLGINMALHGWTRIPAFGKFQAHLQSQFEGSILPAELVSAMSYAIVGIESVIGPLILLGLALRYALIAGGVLIWMLMFGVCLIGNWSTAGSQLTYLAFFAVLLAAIRFDAFSVDSLLRRKERPFKNC